MHPTIRKIVAGLSLVLLLVPPMAPAFAEEVGTAPAAPASSAVADVPSADATPPAAPPSVPDAAAPSLPTDIPAIQLNISPDDASAQPEQKQESKLETEDKSVASKPDSAAKPETAPQAQALTSGPPPAKNESFGSKRVLLSEVEKNTGALTYAYPITIPPGRNGLQPDVKITYNSQDQDIENELGFGWSLNIPFIQRMNKTGLEKIYATTTQLYFSSSLDGEIVTSTSATTTAYAARVENGSFNSYSFSGDRWIMKDKNGTQYTFGSASSSKQYDPSDITHTYKWMLEEVRDTNNNYIKYVYVKDSGQIYPSAILYTGNGSADGIFEVDFIRETRMDSVTSSRSGFAVHTGLRINRLDIKVSNVLTHQYALSYSTGDNGTRSLLSSITELGKDESGNTTTLPPTTFTYQAQTPGWTYDETWLPRGTFVGDVYDNGYRTVDFTGDALADIFRGLGVQPYNAHLNIGHGWADDDPAWWPLVGWTNGGLNNAWRIVDVNGDQRPDMLYADRPSQGPVAYDAIINTGSGWTHDSSWDPPTALTYIDADTGYRLVDVNGDGLTDIIANATAYINNGHGWTADSTWIPPTAITTGWNDIGFYFADLNGDGLLDMMRGVDPPFGSPTSTYEAYINNGHGWDADPTWYPPFTLSSSNYTDKGIKLLDVNGDGLLDLIGSDFGGVGVHTYKSYINNGHGWYSDSSWDLPTLFTTGWSYDQGARFMDFNGDGLPDIAQSQQYDTPEAYVSHARVNALLVSIRNPEGGSEQFEYKPAAQYIEDDGSISNRVPYPIYTVSSTVINDGLGHYATTTYRYQGGYYYYNNPIDKKFAGFTTTTETDPAGNVTKTYFHQGNASDSAHGEYNDDYWKMGKPYRVERYNGASTLYTATINKWDYTDLGSGRGYVFLANTIDSEYNGDASHKDKAEAYTYDLTNGNQTQKIQYGQVTASDDGTFVDYGTDDYTTAISYASSTTSDVKNAVSDVTKTDHSGNKISETRDYYDTLALGSVDKGNQTKEERWKTSTTYINSQKAYNGYGLVTSETDPRAHVTTYGYDTYNLYPITATNPLNQVTQYAYDYSLGKPKQVTDPNGLISQTVYDGLDRVLLQKEPNLVTSSTLDTLSTFTYTDTPGAVSVQDSESLSPTSTVDTYTYYDGLSRPIQTRTEGESNFIVKDVAYNNLGLLQKESLPYFSSGSARTSATSTSALFTTYTYDGIKRPRTQVNALGTTNDTYGDWRMFIVDPDGKQKIYYRDAYDRLGQVDETYVSSTFSTRYSYNGLDNLTKLTDSRWNIRTFGYDGLGRRTSATDLRTPADTVYGTWTYTYDDSGNVTSTLDPSNQRTNYVYDNANRVIVEDFTGTTSTDVTYAYDSCAYGIGSLCSNTSAGASVSYVYNPRKQVAQETKTISGTPFVTTYAYDRLGNVVNMTNPDSSQFAYVYNDAGLLERLNEKESTDASFKPVVTNVDRASNGQIAALSFANGVTTVNTYDPIKLYRLTKKVSTLPDTSKVQDIAYTYDPVGNITQLVDNSSTTTKRTMTYTYDDLHRLTSASATSTAAGVPGYVQTYSYDSIGNILNKSDMGNYGYASGTSDWVNPDAIASVASSTWFAYDKNGNLTSTTGTVTNLYAWDYQNRLTQAAMGKVSTSTYAYDSSGQRTKVTTILASSTVATYYPTKYYNIAASPTKQIYIGDQLVATVSGASSTVYSVLTDHLSGSSIITNPSGGVAELTDYYPYGSIRLDQKNSSFNESRKFIGQEYDADTGLDYLNARYLNGKWGRFVSQDPEAKDHPEKFLKDPQQLNYYSYARNNPITQKDPDGRQVDPGTALEVLTYAPQFFNSVIPAEQALIAQNIESLNTLSNPSSSFVDRSLAGIGLASMALPESYGLERTLGEAASSRIPVGTVLKDFGEVVENSAGKITGFYRADAANAFHGLDRAIERGVSPKDILNTVKNPLITIKQGNENIYRLTNEAAVVLNKAGKVVTTYAKEQFYPKVSQLLRQINKAK